MGNNNYYADGRYVGNGYIIHYGVKGMKWRKRKYSTIGVPNDFPSINNIDREVSEASKKNEDERERVRKDLTRYTSMSKSTKHKELKAEQKKLVKERDELEKRKKAIKKVQMLNALHGNKSTR